MAGDNLLLHMFVSVVCFRLFFRGQKLLFVTNGSLYYTVYVSTLNNCVYNYVLLILKLIFKTILHELYNFSDMIIHTKYIEYWSSKLKTFLLCDFLN